MPSKSKKQARLMRAVAHGWKPDKIKGPTRAVAQEFVNADRRKKVQGYNFGGVTGPGMYRGRDPRQGALSRIPSAAPPRGMPQGQRPVMEGRPYPRYTPPQRGGLGQVGNMMQRGRGPVKPPMGRQIAPPPNKYPGGGNPMMGGRNPMVRQANVRRPMMGGRGATSYFR